MEVLGADDEGGQAQVCSQAFEHAVGEHDEPVTWMQVQLLHAVGGAGLDTEGQVRSWNDFLDSSSVRLTCEVQGQRLEDLSVGAPGSDRSYASAKASKASTKPLTSALSGSAGWFSTAVPTSSASPVSRTRNWVGTTSLSRSET